MPHAGLQTHESHLPLLKIHLLSFLALIMFKPFATLFICKARYKS